MHRSKRRLLLCYRFFLYLALEGITVGAQLLDIACNWNYLHFAALGLRTLVNFLSFPPLLDCIILSSSPCNDAESTGVTQCRNVSFIASLGPKTGQFSVTCCPGQPHKQIMHRFYNFVATALIAKQCFKCSWLTMRRNSMALRDSGKGKGDKGLTMTSGSSGL